MALFLIILSLFSTFVIGFVCGKTFQDGFYSYNKNNSLKNNSINPIVFLPTNKKLNSFKPKELK